MCVSLATKPQLPVPWQRLPLLSLMVFQLCFVLDSREGKKKKKVIYDKKYHLNR